MQKFGDRYNVGSTEYHQQNCGLVMVFQIILANTFRLPQIIFARSFEHAQIH